MNRLRTLAQRALTVQQIVGLKQAIEFLSFDTSTRIDSLNQGAQRTVLVIAPHPDDEVFGCGGAVALHREINDIVHVLYVANGAAGTRDGKTDANLIHIREKEAKAGLELLGGAQSLFWDIPDGTVSPTAQNIDKLRTLIEKINPQLIYTPWVHDNHPDHQAATKILLATIQPSDTYTVRQYEIWSPLIPNTYVPIKSVIKKKLDACYAHESQLITRGYADGIIGLNSYRGMQAGIDGPAEAYLELNAPQTLQLSRSFSH